MCQMLKKYKNPLFDLMQQSALSRELFDIKETEHYFHLKLRDHWHSFEMANDPLNFANFAKVITDPGSLTRSGILAQPMASESYDLSFPKVKHRFSLWLTEVAKPIAEDIDLPDLWSRVSTTGSVFEGKRLDEGRFTDKEKDAVTKALSEFRELLKLHIQTSEDQQRTIDERLGYLLEAVERLSHRDWSGVALSTAIGIATNLGLDKTDGQMLLNLFRQAIGGTVKMLSGA